MYLEHIRKTLKSTKIWNIKLEVLLNYLALFIIIISVSTQIFKLIKTGSAKNYSLYFILLQLIATPEGGGAAITGYVHNNHNLFIMGLLGFIYYSIALYYYLFPRNFNPK